jgi:hypothetical protein
LKDSFGGAAEADWYKTKNSLLEIELKEWFERGPSVNPGITINNMAYRGELSAEDVFMTICAGFKDTPAECQVHSTTEIMNPGISMGTIVSIVIGLIFLNFIIIFCYRRLARRKMHDEMQVQVNSAVSQYFALSDRDVTKD